MEYVLHPRSEIDTRIKKLQGQMKDLTGAILFESVDMGYFSGTAQDGLVYIPKDNDPVVMIRKSLQRAVQESPLDVHTLKNLKNLKADLRIPSGAVIGLELDILYLPASRHKKIAIELLNQRMMPRSIINAVGPYLFQIGQKDGFRLFFNFRRRHKCVHANNVSEI
jgi:hypothetical protein